MCRPPSSLPTVAPLGMTWMGDAADREGPSSGTSSPCGLPLDSGTPAAVGGTAGALQAAGQPGGPEGPEGPGWPGAPTSRATSLRGGAGQATLLWVAACECGLPGRAGGAADHAQSANARKYPLCLCSWAEWPHRPRPLVAGHGDHRLSALSSAASVPGGLAHSKASNTEVPSGWWGPSCSPAAL